MDKLNIKSLLITITIIVGVLVAIVIFTLFPTVKTILYSSLVVVLLGIMIEFNGRWN